MRRGRRAVWLGATVSVVALTAAVAMSSGKVAGEEEDPIPPRHTVSELAPVDDLAAEAESIIDSIGKALASQKSYQQRAEDVSQQGVVLAILADAVAQHEDDAKWKPTAGQIRDASIGLTDAADYSGAQATYQEIRGLLDGEPAEPYEPIPMAEFVELKHVMKEFQDRCTLMTRLFAPERFTAGKGESARASSVISVLARIVYDNANWTTDDSQQAQWHRLAGRLSERMSHLAATIRAGDYATARILRQNTLKNCSTCHRTFRDI